MGPAEIALTRILLRPEIDREIAHRSFERGLGHAHHIIIRHRTQTAIVGERHHRAAVRHQRRGALCGFGEGVAGDHHGTNKVFARGIGVTALQFILVGEGNSVHEKIHCAPLLLDLGKHGIDRGNVLDVAWHHEGRARLFGQRLHPFGQRIALIGESELCTVLCKCFRNSPGDRVVVRHPHDQSAFALHQAATRGSMLISHGRWPTRDE